MMSNYASWGRHAKHRNILAVNLPDTFRCPKRQIATKKYKIICLSSMCYLKQKKKQCKVQFAHCLFKICPPINDSIQARIFFTFLVWRDTSFKEAIPLYLTSLSVSLQLSLHLRYLCLSDFSSNHSKIYPGMLSVF